MHPLILDHLRQLLWFIAIKISFLATRTLDLFVPDGRHFFQRVDRVLDHQITQGVQLEPGRRQSREIIGESSLPKFGQRKPGKDRQTGLFEEVSSGWHTASHFIRQTYSNFERQVQSMKAIVITKPGGPDVLRIQDREAPQPTRDEILIEVKASGLNRADVFQREGSYPAPPGVPADIPGLEGSGIARSCD